MREVLFAADGSEDAERACRLLAGLPRPSDGRVTVVTAIPPAAALWLGRIPPEEGLPTTVEAGRGEAMRQIAEDAARTLRAGGWDAHARVRVGPAAQEILEAAREIPAELIVTGSKGLTGLPAFFLGSVAQNVAKHAECSGPGGTGRQRTDRDRDRRRGRLAGFGSRGGAFPLPSARSRDCLYGAARPGAALSSVGHLSHRDGRHGPPGSCSAGAARRR